MRCTAPVQGHRTASGRANCPVCGGRSFVSYPSSFYAFPTINAVSSSSSSSRGVKQTKRKARWSSKNSTILYTDSEIRTLTPVRANVEKRSGNPDLRDVFLCHAWDDRKGAAKELNDLLESEGVSVWFSEKDVPLGSNLHYKQ